MGYKWSLYNILMKDINDDLIFANTMSGKVLLFDKKYENNLRNIDKWHPDKELADIFIHNGFMIPQDLDEQVQIDYLYGKSIFNDNSLAITIVPTEQCNMRCLYCYEPHEEKNISDDNVNRLIKFIKYQMQDSGNVFISWFGGEPLLRIDVIEKIMNKVVKFGEFYKKEVTSHITTNGTLLNPEVFDKLYEWGIRSYQITLDGFREKHNYYRPMLSEEDGYSRIINNLKYIKSTLKRVTVLIRINVLPKEKEHILDFIKYIDEEFLTDKRFQIQVYNVRNWGGDSVKQFNIENLSNYDSLIQQIISLGIDPQGTLGLIKPLIWQCELASIRSFYINYDLTVHKCASTVYDENYKDGLLGTINEYGRLALNEELLAKWSNNSYFKQSCVKCKFYPVCMSHICPYAINFLKQKNCEDHIAQFKNKIKYIASKLDKTR